MEEQMTSNDWSISVIIPVYNGAAFISEAIESVLSQSHQAMEIVVIDDGSTDETASIVRQFDSPVRYHYQTNGGTGVARNNGIRIATGRFLAFLDADDLWTKDKLARQVALFQQDPNLDLVWGNVVEFSGEKSSGDDGGPTIPGHHPGTALIRRQAFEIIGEFSEVYQQAEVVEWASRVLQSAIKQLMLPDTLMYRRIHKTNKGLSNPNSNQEYLQVLKRHLDRRRSKT